MINKRARVIAFYLPQFHPIPENDNWWGRGFTEWTNVGKAKPLFKGHYQPRVPADLGYYDLRMPEVREAQADMAREAGIEGFCYWHYWFGDGRELLDRPFKEVLKSKKPDFPFCLGWANHSWTNKSWKVGKKFIKEGVLIEQKYNGLNDIDLHFNLYLDAFKDDRYILVDGKILFVVFSPFSIPDVQLFINRWNELAILNGLKGFHFVGITESFEINTDNSNNNKTINLSSIKNIDNAGFFYKRVLDLGFNAVNSRTYNYAQIKTTSLVRNYLKKMIANKVGVVNKYEYSEIIKHLIVNEDSWDNVYPTIIPNWDRSPRSGSKAAVWHRSTPDLFKKHVSKAINIVSKKPDEHKIIFLQSWNEWAEGNYIEPDLVFGKSYLNILKETLL